MTYKLLILSPKLAQPSHIQALTDRVQTALGDAQITALDSLGVMDASDTHEFYRYWKERLQALSMHYDVFIGFSLGGVILQQCLGVFEGMNKKVVLFSTPSFVNSDLNAILSQVKQLALESKLEQALLTLYRHVYLNESQLPRLQISDEAMAIKRINYGIERVLTTDSRPILAQSRVNYIHYIGQCSQLVNRRNVVCGLAGAVIEVPGAGMRVLEDNLEFCKASLLEILNEE